MSRPHTRARLLAVFLAVIALVALTTAPSGKAQAALSGSQFNPANIISDAAFFNANAMSQADIQTFLVGKEPTCGNTSCLKLYTQKTTTVKADVYGHCKQYTGAANESAAAIIFKVQQACGVSAKALLVTLEKEQGLVSSKAPTSSMIQKAMGFACPDTAACNTAYYGFFNQVFHAAYQFQVYVTNPSSFAYAAGRTSKIAYNPSASCGTQTVTIANKATAALYNYTPYVPNAAALANLYGVGNSCSAYGNRNFWRLYNDWFGSGNSPFGAYDTATVKGSTITVTGWAIDPVVPTASLSILVGVVAPSGKTSTIQATANVNRPDVGTAYSYSKLSNGTAPHGFTIPVPRTETGSYKLCVSALPAAGNTAPRTVIGCKSLLITANGVAAAVTRLQGAQRWDTAAAISAKAFPYSGVPVVYIASGESFADGLSAAPAAAKQGGPVLFVQQNSVPSATLAELKRLKPARIIVVGGANAVSGAVVTKLQTVQKSVGRIGGATRYQTAQLIAKSAFPTATTAFVATGTDYPDALSAGAAAGSLTAPVLLVDGASKSNDSSLASLLKATKVKKVYVVGGTSAVSAASVKGLSSIGASVARIAGTDRYDTSTRLSNAVFSKAPSVYFASGATYPDALAGAVLAGRNKSPLLVSRTTCVPGAQQQAALKLGVSSLTILGGAAALGPQIDTLAVCR